MIKFESKEFLRAELETASNGNSRLAKDYLNIENRKYFTEEKNNNIMLLGKLVFQQVVYKCLVHSETAGGL